MPALDETQTQGQGQGQSQSETAKPIVGIIYPPPEVRNIVDKTANFVARNGPEFEARIRQNEINNPKFNFLNIGDPYNAYYQHKVRECSEGKTGPEPVVAQSKMISGPQQKAMELFKQLEQQAVPKEPPPDFEFVADPPSISAFDLDVVKLTAQFVARNGRQFLTNLMNREQRNYQFDFLRPQHSLFQYFTKLLEQYTKILIPPKELMKKLSTDGETMNSVMEQVKYRVEWHKHQEAKRLREEAELEKERVSYAQIDWHDFVVVETVDYQPFEQGHFPAPTTPDKVGQRVLIQDRADDGEEVDEMQLESDEEEGEDEDEDKEDEDEESEDEDEEEDEGEEKMKKTDSAKDNTQVQDMEEDSSSSSSSDEEEDEKSVPPLPKDKPQPPPLPPNPDQVVIKKDYDPKAPKVQRSATDDQFLISPITGEKIPARKVAEHMRIGLLDPRWVEQRDRQLHDKVNQENVYAGGVDIESSLKDLAERRTDIFGAGDEETGIGKKIGEEEKKKDDKVIWDGHTGSMEATARAARANITVEDQINQIHKVKGLLPDDEKEKIGPKKTVPPPPLPRPPAPPSQPLLSKPNIAPLPKPPPPPPPPQRAPMPPPMMAQGPPTIAVVQTPVIPIQQGMMMAPPMGGPMRGPLMMAPQPAFVQPVRHEFLQPMPPPPMRQPDPAPPPPPMDDDEGPPNKRQRTEEHLIPEEQFLSTRPPAVTFRVHVPNLSEKPEWRLNGQMVALTLPLTDTVSVIKAKLHDETGMPPAKQKLQADGMFFKDSNSLAYYNITGSTVVQLQLKERGGRKK